jgi:hypothetical protein
MCTVQIDTRKRVEHMLIVSSELYCIHNSISCRSIYVYYSNNTYICYKQLIPLGGIKI